MSSFQIWKTNVSPLVFLFSTLSIVELFTVKPIPQSLNCRLHSIWNEKSEEGLKISIREVKRKLIYHRILIAR